MITIPKQFYVGLRKQIVYGGEEVNPIPLGFATPYDDAHTKAFVKRKETVDDWVDQYSGTYDSATREFTKIPRDLEPKIIDNTPLEGFKIAEDIRRIYWGGGNVVWRLVHPLGFEFEIPSSNLARIIDCTTIINGVIQGKCLLGRDKAQNLLLPEGSEPYKEAYDNTIRVAKKVNIKDVKPGDIVILKDGREVTYLGLYYTVSAGLGQDRHFGSGSSYYDNTYKLANIAKRYFFYEPLTEAVKDKFKIYDNKTTGYTYTCTADHHIKEIKQSAGPWVQEFVAGQINEYLKTQMDSRFDSLRDVYYVSATPITEVKFEERPWSLTEERSEPEGHRSPFTYVRHENGQKSRVAFPRYPSNPAIPDAELYDLNGDPFSGVMTYIVHLSRKNTTVPASTLNNKQWVRLVAVFNGKDYELSTY